MDTFYPQALAGFIMVLTEEGDMIYLTENISRYIGLAQVQQNKKQKYNNQFKHSGKVNKNKSVYTSDFPSYQLVVVSHNTLLEM